MVVMPPGERGERSPPGDAVAVVWLVRLLEWAVMALLGTITLLVIVEICLRWLAGGASLIIHEEATRYLMIWTAMLGAALLVHEDGHIRIASFTEMLPPFLARLCYYLSQAVVLFFLGFLVGTSAVNLPQMVGQDTVTLGISMAWFFAALPVGGGLMFLLVCYDVFETARGRRGRGTGDSRT